MAAIKKVLKKTKQKVYLNQNVTGIIVLKC